MTVCANTTFHQCVLPNRRKNSFCIIFLSKINNFINQVTKNEWYEKFYIFTWNDIL